MGLFTNLCCRFAPRLHDLPLANPRLVHAANDRDRHVGLCDDVRPDFEWTAARRRAGRRGPISKSTRRFNGKSNGLVCRDVVSFDIDQLPDRPGIGNVVPNRNIVESNPVGTELNGRPATKLRMTAKPKSHCFKIHQSRSKQRVTSTTSPSRVSSNAVGALFETRRPLDLIIDTLCLTPLPCLFQNKGIGLETPNRHGVRWT